MSKVVMLINDTTYAYNLRAALIRELIEKGIKVVIVCRVLKHKDKLEAMGAEIIEAGANRHGTNPLEDLKLLHRYKQILKEERPDVVLTYNIKPNVYGGMACRRLKIPFLVNVTGLGTPVENPGVLQKLSILLYKNGVKGAACVFFQNAHNLAFFQEHHMLTKSAKARVIPGSGVDLAVHPLLPWPQEKELHFLFAARVMREKGIDYFLSAARRFADETTIFDVCGACDDERYLELLQNEPAVRYHGEQGDLTPFYQKASCFLYPSYYPEGMSNVLLEAAAAGRPVIAADRAGCRETLENEVTGYLVPIKDEKVVLEAVERFLNLSDEERRQMGQRGREKMEREFDRRFVVEAYLEEINKIIKC